MNGLEIAPAGLRLTAQIARLTIREQHAVLTIVGALVRNPPPRYRVADEVSVSDLMAELGFSSFADAAAVADLVDYIGTITAVDVATALDTLAEMGLQSVDDAAAVLENLQQLTFLGTQADAAVATDGVITLMTNAQAEAVTVAEVVLGLFSIPFADAASASDALSTALSFNPINDGAGTADAFTFFGKVNPADAVTAADTSTSTIIGLPGMWARPGEFYPGAARPGAARATIQTVGALGDSATSSDAVATTATRAQADAATPSDATTWMGVVNVSDAVLPYEAVSTVVTASVADGATAAEALTRLGAMSVADGATASDAVLQSYTTALADGASATDGISLSGLSAQAADAASVADATAPVGLGTAADSATPSDAVAAMIALQRDDGATATELPQLTGISMSVADAATAAESVSGKLTTTVADSATASESVSSEFPSVALALLDLNGTPFDRGVTNANWNTTGTQNYVAGKFASTQAYDASSLSNLPHLESPTNDPAALGSGIFAIEFFMRAAKIPGNAAQYQWIMGAGADSSATWGFYLSDYTDSGTPGDGSIFCFFNDGFDGFRSTSGEFNAFTSSASGFIFCQIIRDGTGQITFRWAGPGDTETVDAGFTTDFSGIDISPAVPVRIGPCQSDGSPGVGALQSMRITTGTVPSFNVPTGLWP